MDDLDFSHVLDGGDRPEATPDVLRQVLARHRHRRARQYRVVATSAIVVALAGAGVGVGLDQNGGTKAGLSTTSGSPPAGLKWDTSLSGATAPSVSPQLSAAPSSAKVATVSPEPGEFGFVESTPNGLGVAQRATSTEAVPVIAGTTVGGSLGLRSAAGCNMAGGCGVVYDVVAPRTLFTRHIGDVTVRVSVVNFAFPVSIHQKGGPIPVTGTPAQPGATTGVGTSGHANGSVPTAGTSGTASSGGTSTTGSTVVSSPPTPTPSPVQTRNPIPVVGACLAGSELEVVITRGASSATLFVPSGGTSTRPFSVVASAATRLASGPSVALVVARTSGAVSSVSATFSSGGSDSMAPQGGWVVLGTLVPASSDLAKAGAVTVTATSRSGATLEKATLPASGALATAPVASCRYLVEPLNPGSIATGPPTTGPTGSSGSGSSSGSIGSGSSGSSVSGGAPGSATGASESASTSQGVVAPTPPSTTS